MKWDGMKFNRAKHIAFRMGRPDEVDGEGRGIDIFYAAFVYVKDCPVNDNGRFDPSKADKRIPGVYVGTNKMYGKSRKRTNHNGKRVWDGTKKEHVFATEYYTTPVYLAFDGRVFTSSIAHLHND